MRRYLLEHLLLLNLFLLPTRQVPVYQRGGTIVPKRERIRRSAALMHQDPVTLVSIIVYTIKNTYVDMDLDHHSGVCALLLPLLSYSVVAIW